MRVHVENVADLLSRAIEGGATVTAPRRVAWDISSDCHEPVSIEVQEDTVGSARVDLAVRCRKCTHCRRFRQRCWAMRAADELALAAARGARSWFVTLTLDPDARRFFRYQAISLFDDGGKACEGDFEHLTPQEQFVLIHARISKDITRYIKRARQEAVSDWKSMRLPTKGKSMRYCLVCESHEEGFPDSHHYHILAHEPAAGYHIGNRLLKGQWPHGFVDATLVGAHPEDAVSTAWYLAKYLAKDARSRVRASLRYGRVLNTAAAATFGS